MNNPADHIYDTEDYIEMTTFAHDKRNKRMKLNLISPDELVDLVDCENIDDEAEFINQLIEEKLTHVVYDTDVHPALFGDISGLTNVYFITTPIETTTTCNHTYITTTGSRTFPHQTDFCPDCGDKLHD